MRDRTAERAGLGSFGVDVDPLVIARCIGEGVHLFLGDLDVRGVAEVLADERLEFIDSVDRAGHGPELGKLRPMSDETDDLSPLGSPVEVGLPIRVRHVRRPPERRQVVARERDLRSQDQHRLGQAADHSAPDHGRAHPSGVAARVRRHAGAPQAGDRARRARQRHGARQRRRRGRRLSRARRDDALRQGRSLGRRPHRHRQRHRDREQDRCREPRAGAPRC